MAHFAELDENNLVLRVVVVNNDCCLDDQGNESEAIGATFCAELFGGYKWVQTSYNGSFRKNFAGIGYSYDEQRDAFIGPKPPAPYDDHVLNEQTCQWEPPIPCPGTLEEYYWDADTKAWMPQNLPATN